MFVAEGIADGLATGVASRRERFAAAGFAVTIVALLVTVLPFAGTPAAVFPAFTPLAGTFLALPQFLTALVFFNQYAVGRSRALAIVGSTFLIAAILSFAYVVEFPDVFDSTGLFSDSAQTSSYLYNAQNVLFACGVLLYVGATRMRGEPESRVRDRFGRYVVIGSLAFAFGVWFVSARFGPQLPVLVNGQTFSSPLTSVVAPLVYGTTIAALVAIVAVRRFHSVTDLWLAVVILAKFAQELLTGPLGVGRYSIGWYYGRVEAVLAAVLILAAFLIRLNALTIVLAARNRTLRQRSEDDAMALAASELRYRALAESLPQLVFTLDGHGSLEYANARLLQYAGVPLGELVAHGMDAMIDGRDRARAVAHVRAAIAAGTGFDLEYRLRDVSDGMFRWFLCRASIERDARGAPVRWFGTLTEIEAQKQVEARDAFLSHATESFGASLELKTTVEAIARVAVPTLSSWVRVECFGADGEPSVVASIGENAACADRVRARLGGGIRGEHEDALDRLALGEHVLLLDGDGQDTSTVVAFPLLAREQMLGTVAFAVPREYGERREDARLGRSFARRAAIALERALLYHRERRIADTLQQAMLPDTLPQRTDLTFSAAYSAASERERVGGDFYDAFVVPDGRLAIVIGDVAGHGLEAAVTMGQVRQSIRAAAFETPSPSRILDRASQLFAASGRSGMVTAIVSLFDPRTARLTYAIAGHPAPILRTRDGVERLSGSGLPLGLRDDLPFDAEVTVPVGAAIAFFTDGLIEVDRDIIGGEHRVGAAFATLADVSPEIAAETLRDRVLAGRAPADDVAVLVVTLAPNAGSSEALRTRSWSFHAMDSFAAGVARESFVAFAQRSLSFDAVDDAELIYGELLANVVQHAPGPVTVAAECEGSGAFGIVVEDRGPGFTLVERPASDSAESGRGWGIVARLSQNYAVETLAVGSRVRARIGGRDGADGIDTEPRR